jgi:predicted DNA-binding transcriptional regulator AlpA
MKKKDTAKRKLRDRCRVFGGITRLGKLRIREHGRVRLCVGQVFPLTEVVTAEGVKWKRASKPLYETEGFTRAAPATESFRCFSESGDCYYRIYCTPIPKRIHKANSDESVSATPTNDVSRKRNRLKHKLRSQLDAIAAQKRAGLDPDVRMAFISPYLGESRANLYKKMGDEFPLPTKRGRGSFWPLSVIDAYKAKNRGAGARDGQ